MTRRFYQRMAWVALLPMAVGSLSVSFSIVTERLVVTWMVVLTYVALGLFAWAVRGSTR